MQQDSFGIRDAFKRDPEGSGFLIKFGFGGALAIAVLGAVAALVLNPLLGAPVTLLVALLYGVALVLVTARVVATAVGRRFVESAMTLRSTLNAAAGEAKPAPAAPVREQASFNQSYFMLRLQEEVGNARRDGREMALVAIEATAPGVPMNPELANRIAQEFARIASDHHRTISNALSVSESEYVLSLPMTSAVEAKAFVSLVVQALGNYWCHFGLAVYPADGTSAEGLVKAARAAVQESREGRTNTKTHAVA
jgi:GGDEF domain-containing protein